MQIPGYYHDQATTSPFRTTSGLTAARAFGRTLTNLVPAEDVEVVRLGHVLAECFGFTWHFSIQQLQPPTL
jgi:hypothetical protein